MRKRVSDTRQTSRAILKPLRRRAGGLQTPFEGRATELPTEGFSDAGSGGRFLPIYRATVVLGSFSEVEISLNDLFISSKSSIIIIIFYF